MLRKKLPYGNTDGALTLDQLLATAIDENELIEKDTLSDLQNGPTPTAGRVAEVGQSDIYLGDGTQWVAAADVSWGSANNPNPVFTEQVGESVVTATTGSSYDVDVTEGTVWDLTLDNNVTISFSGEPSSVASSVTLVLTQDGTGGRSVTWPSEVDWPGGSAPSLSTAANATDIVMLFTPDGGTTWYGQDAGTGYS